MPMSQKNDALTETETATGPIEPRPHLVVKRALVEFRRQQLEFLDVRGKIGQSLMDAYQTVDASVAGPTDTGVIATARWTVRSSASDSRTGAIDFHQAVYEDSAVADISDFVSEAIPFLRRSTKLLGSRPIERLGVLFSFELDGYINGQSLLNTIAGPVGGEKGMFFDASVNRLERTDARVAKITMQFNAVETSTPENQLARVIITVDQFEMKVPYTDALKISLAEWYQEAVRLSDESMESLFESLESRNA